MSHSKGFINGEEQQEEKKKKKKSKAHDNDSPPDSPTSRLLNRIAEIKLDSEEDFGSSPDRKFSYVEDIARNPKISQAARLESVSGQATPTAGLDDSLAFLSHDPDIDRQKEVCEALDRDTELESRLNQEMASVVISRIQSGRSSAEKILSVLQAFASANRSYGKSLSTIGGMELIGDADGATLRDALADFVQLPMMVGDSHDRASHASQPSINLVRDLVGKLREACAELKQGALKVQTDVDLSMKALRQSVVAHRDVESDPWIAEGRLVERQAALRIAQANQRKYLAGAFRRVGELERQRISVTKMALTNCVELMASSISLEIREKSDSALGSLGAVDGESDLDSFASMAADSTKGGEVLSRRQSQMIQYLWRQLEGSVDVIRQGRVRRMDSRRVWVAGYAVLTRAGFLHWFPTNDSTEDRMWIFSGGPECSIHLSRCEFELGDAPSWKLKETASMSWLSGKTVHQTYSTDDIDACMDWTADLKEMISMYKIQ
eukprot:jgi/Picre1/29908/NNA_005289.t1